MRVEKTEDKSVKEEKTNNNVLVIDTVKDYQSYDMNLEDAIKNTAKLLRMSEAEVKELLPVIEEKEIDGNTITLESITCRLTKAETQFLESIISEASQSDKDDDEKGKEKKESTDDAFKKNLAMQKKKAEKKLGKKWKDMSVAEKNDAIDFDFDDKKKESVDEVIYTIEEDIDIPGTDITLEKGDKFIVVTESDEEDDKEDDEEEVEEKKKGSK